MNPYIARNTLGFIYPYIPDSIILFPKKGFSPNIGLLYYIPPVKRLLIFLFSAVHRAEFISKINKYSQYKGQLTNYIMTTINVTYGVTEKEVKWVKYELILSSIRTNGFHTFV